MDILIRRRVLGSLYAARLKEAATASASWQGTRYEQIRDHASSSPIWKRVN